MSITPYPTLSQRMTALHSRMVAVADAFAEQGDVSAATAVKAQAKQLKQEHDAFQRDLGAALTGIKVDPEKAKETDLFAGDTQAPPPPDTVAGVEAERARTILKHYPAPPHGTWGWLYVPKGQQKRRAYKSANGYIDEYGIEWHPSSIRCFEADPPHVDTCEEVSRAAALAIELRSYKDAIDSQPWATDEPIRVQLDRITTRLADYEPYKKYVELIKEILGDRPEGENECPDPLVVVRNLKQRCRLLNWIAVHVDKIDFEVKVPPSVFTSNPWIAFGHNFESAVAKARDALTKATS